MKKFTSEEILVNFKGAVCQYIDSIPHDIDVCPDGILVSWFVKNLQNCKACLFVPEYAGLYFECSFNGNTNEIYLDVYKKVENQVYHLK
jgi:hypothetical protein